MMTFMAALPDAKWVGYYTVAFGTGLRPSEQNALQWEHIDFAGKTILVRQGVVRGRKTLLKTKGSRRDVDMLPMVEETLRAHFEVASGQYVFSNAIGGPLFQEGMRRRVWHPTIERAALRHRNPYQTRHTFASLMLSQGEEVAWVARMMGHTTTRMIYEHYYRFIPHRTRQDGDRFTKAFEEAKTRQPSLDHP
jgi:integrase